MSRVRVSGKNTLNTEYLKLLPESRFRHLFVFDLSEKTIVLLFMANQPTPP